MSLCAFWASTLKASKNDNCSMALWLWANGLFTLQGSSFPTIQFGHWKKLELPAWGSPLASYQVHRYMQLFLGRPCGDGEAAEAFKALEAYQYVKSGVYIPYVLYVVQVQHIRLSDKFVTLMNYCFKTHKIRKKAPKNYLQHALINLLHGYLKQRLSDESFTHRQGNFQKQLKARVFTCNVLMSLQLPSSVLVT